MRSLRRAAASAQAAIETSPIAKTAAPVPVGALVVPKAVSKTSSPRPDTTAAGAARKA